jgi:hypothetical protein
MKPQAHKFQGGVNLGPLFFWKGGQNEIPYPSSVTIFPARRWISSPLCTTRRTFRHSGSVSREDAVRFRQELCGTRRPDITMKWPGLYARYGTDECHSSDRQKRGHGRLPSAISAGQPVGEGRFVRSRSETHPARKVLGDIVSSLRD